MRTSVLGLRRDLCKKLDKVGQVIAEELGTNNQVLARVVGLESRAQELRLALYPQSRSPLGGLFIMSISPESVFHPPVFFRICPTLKAYCSRASVRPGRPWYLVPAFATMARLATGPGMSLLANLMPCASPDW
jgi:hypothetical protein